MRHCWCRDRNEDSSYVLLLTGKMCSCFHFPALLFPETESETLVGDHKKYRVEYDVVTVLKIFIYGWALMAQPNYQPADSSLYECHI